MSVLFGKRRQTKAKNKLKHENDEIPELPTSGNVITTVNKTQPSILDSFLELNLDPWIVKKCELIGIRNPTPVQAACIPQIINGRNVIACAQTGAGKTAAFALPILHSLSQDPYGPYAVILTPTRELAFQISEQFHVFGTCIGVRCTVIVGGVDMLKQALALQELPHIIIATPGRLRDHLLRANPPNLSLVKYLVLDEADRLMEDSFASDVNYLLNEFKKHTIKRQTLCFSATMTNAIKKLELLQDEGMDPFHFDATPSIKTVTTLKQYYLFIPQQVKLTYLVYLMKLLEPEVEIQEEKNITKHRNKRMRKEDLLQQTILALEHDAKEVFEAAFGNNKRSAMMLFVSTCQQCELIGEIARELNVNCVTLHSMMSQNRRLAALGKFKSGISHFLIATDVASRGLDIPTVDIVINYDLPRTSDDYIHRVGRTARAGRSGQAISLVTQHDIELLKHIESVIGKEMDDFEPLAKENDVLKLLNDVTTASRVAKMKLNERGFDDKVTARKERRKIKHIKKGINNRRK